MVVLKKSQKVSKSLKKSPGVNVGVNVKRIDPRPAGFTTPTAVDRIADHRGLVGFEQ